VRAAFFDLDKTVIARASIVAFGGPLRRRGLVNRRTVARAVLGQLLFLWFGADEQKMAKIRESMLEVSAGWDRDEVRSIVEETLNEVIEPLIYAEAQALITQHRAKGDRIWLVSSAPEEIVEPLAAMLGVDGAIASRAEIDDEGRYTGKISFYAQGEGKAVAIRELAASHHLDLEGSSAYSDSVTDIPMLSVVGHPFAVNPDRALAREAKVRGWEVLTFANPVRLRDRTAIRLPAVGGAIALLALLLAGFGKSKRAAA
jgi:HAD superfamily hydrolase (TIGR01490 family)